MMKFSGYLPWGKRTSFMTSGMTQSSMSLVRNLQCQQSTPLLDPPSWHTSNCDINTKFSGYLPWGKRTSEMTSGMTLSSMSQVRNPQHPPSTPLLDLPLLGTLLIEISTQNFQGMLQSNFCPLPLPQAMIPPPPCPHPHPNLPQDQL